jgi:hypothetical protein
MKDRHTSTYGTEAFTKVAYPSNASRVLRTFVPSLYFYRKGLYRPAILHTMPTMGFRNESSLKFEKQSFILPYEIQFALTSDIPSSRPFSRRN